MNAQSKRKPDVETLAADPAQAAGLGIDYGLHLDPIEVKQQELRSAEAAADLADSAFAEKEAHRLAMAHKDLDSQTEASARVLQAATNDSNIARSRMTMAHERVAVVRREVAAQQRAALAVLYDLAMSRCSREGVFAAHANVIARAVAAKVELEAIDADYRRLLADALKAREEAHRLAIELGLPTNIPNPNPEWVGLEIASAIKKMPSRWPAPQLNYIANVVVANQGAAAVAEGVKAS